MNHITTLLVVLILFSESLFSQKIEDKKESGCLKYYKDSYEDSRKSFLEHAKTIQLTYSKSKLISIKVPSETDKDLTVDLFYVPCIKEIKRIMVLSSGVHGVEGFVGSAIQSMFFDKFMTEEFLNESGMLFIHSVNPYGFKYHRRVTENNVDVNRNSSNNPDLYKTVNEGYPEVYDFINPKDPLNTKSCGNRFFFFKAVGKILKASMSVLRQAILQGQYQFSEGLYFGGQTFEPQISALNPVIDSICEPYDLVFAIDLHTGYGERGKLHLFPIIVDEGTKKRLETVFYGYEIDWADSEGFYTVKGDFTEFIGDLNKDNKYLPMTFEYGTMDSQKTSGSIKSIQIMIEENQGAHYGYKKERDSVKVNSDLMEMYYPSSDEWKIKIMNETVEMFKLMLPRFLEEK